MLIRDVKNSRGQFFIVVLYRQAELHIKRVVERAHPVAGESKLFNFKALKIAIPFNVEAFPKFSSFNELRMLDSAVKHQGKVSDELSESFQNWKLGEGLTGLDGAYERLKPEIVEFISGFVAGCYQARKQT